MYSPSEQSFSLQTLSSSQAAVLPHTDLSVTQQLIEDIIPARVWDVFENAASKNDFYYPTAFKLLEQQKISKAVFDQVSIFWDKAREFEAQGYTLHELKLGIHFKSDIAETEVTCEIIANQTGGELIVKQTQIDAAPVLIDISKTTINPESIPSLIAAVRDGIVPDGIPTIMVDGIKRRLTENPQWKVNEITQMGSETHIVPLYEITINTSLFFKPVSSESMIGNQAVPIMRLTASEISTEVSPSICETSLLMQTISSESQMVSGLCSSSFFMEAKRTGADKLPTFADLSLTSGAK